MQTNQAEKGSNTMAHYTGLGLHHLRNCSLFTVHCSLITAMAPKRKNTEALPYEGLSKHQFITLAHEAIGVLGWSIRYQSGTHIVALTDNGVLSKNAVVSISLEDEGAAVHSEAT